MTTDTRSLVGDMCGKGRCNLWFVLVTGRVRPPLPLLCPQTPGMPLWKETGCQGPLVDRVQLQRAEQEGRGPDSFGG